MKFLVDDLGLSTRKDLMVEIFNREIPHVGDDVVVIFIQVSGYKDGIYQAETYSRKFYNDKNLTAIQMTTASGICTVIDYWANGKWMHNVDDPKHSFNIVSPEQIPEAALQDNLYWSLYSN